MALFSKRVYYAVMCAVLRDRWHVVVVWGGMHVAVVWLYQCHATQGAGEVFTQQR